MFILIAALALPLSAYTKATRDANPRENQNTEGANREGGIEGGLKTDEQKEGGCVRDETSSDREEGRGARGVIRRP